MRCESNWLFVDALNNDLGGPVDEEKRRKSEVFPLRKTFEGEDRSLLKIVRGRNFDFSPHSAASPVWILNSNWPRGLGRSTSSVQTRHTDFC
jgi:hypothetical protein